MHNIKPFLAAAILILLSGCAEQPYSIVTEPSGQRMLLGEFPLNVLRTDTSFAGWFEKQYSAYDPAKKEMALLAGVDKNYAIVVCMGTWCSDSRREVPRFMKVMESAGLPATSIRFFAVDHQKRSPENAAQKFNVTLVPTIIVFRAGMEIGRITEMPEVSMEDDLGRILRK
jgi:thiol-disulfide isomerase/thioredoxin